MLPYHPATEKNFCSLRFSAAFQLFFFPVIFRQFGLFTLILISYIDTNQKAALAYKIAPVILTVGTHMSRLQCLGNCNQDININIREEQGVLRHFVFHPLDQRYRTAANAQVSDMGYLFC